VTKRTQFFGDAFLRRVNTSSGSLARALRNPAW
jgi:hypothetical protein